MVLILIKYNETVTKTAEPDQEVTVESVTRK